MSLVFFGLGNSNFDGSDPLQDGQQWSRSEFQTDQTGTVVAATKYRKIHRVGKILELRACITETIATGADRTVTIDLLRSTAGGAFASVLSATVVLNNLSTLLVDMLGTLNTTALAAGDTLKLTVAVAGAAGAQALGLSVSALLTEQPS
jgi:hypothetical protein